VSQFAKAIYATVVAGLGALATPLVADTGIGDLTAGQWVTVALAALIAGGGVYGIRNAPAE
jgi:hypothetical protein